MICPQYTTCPECSDTGWTLHYGIEAPFEAAGCHANEDGDAGRLASHYSLLAEQNSIPANIDWNPDDEDLSDCQGGGR